MNPRVCILCASARKNNNTMRLARQMSDILNDRNGEYSMVDFVGYDFPSFNDGFLNKNSLSPFQDELISSWAKADLIIVLSPEYNWFPTAEIINVVNHLGSSQHMDLWDGKVFAFAGVSTGYGGRMPAVQLTGVFNKIISYTHSMSVCSPKIYESHFTAEEIDEEGKINEAINTRKAIERFIDFNLSLTAKWIRS